MKTLKWIPGGIAVLSLVLGLAGPIAASAATAPTLLTATPFSTWGKAGVKNFAGVTTTHLWGDVGADSGTTNLQVGPGVGGVVDVAIIEPTPAQVQTDIQTTAYGQLTAQGPGTVLNLASPPVSIGPGVYDIAATTLAGPLNLVGAGVYIFLGSSTTPVTGGVGSSVNLSGGASACDVYWGIADSMTIGANSHIEGTIITNTAAITMGDSVTLKGRAFSSVAAVTLLNDQITNPCAAAPPQGTSKIGTVNVVKVVVNDNGGTKTVSDFPLFVDGTLVTSGVTNTFPSIPGIYSVTETGSAGYARSFSGDCDANGQFNLTPGQNKFCIITNNDIGAPVVVPPVPPLIDVVKVPSPLSLPNGPGSVLYTYTTRNIGTVPMSNVTMVGDSCSPIVLKSGDTNGDSKLDVNETWVYTCTTNLTETHTNTVVATGWANGISAVHIASATVVVGQPVVPPLIHVTKVPSPLTLLAGGGMVTYTEKITNPGTVALSNVTLNDNKCSSHFVSGDTNHDSKLDPSETWTYTCQSNLTQTTTNTVSVSGQANGLIARDFAVVTVVVAAAVPTLPKTGFVPADSFPVAPALAVGILAASGLLFVIRKKQNA